MLEYEIVNILLKERHKNFDGLSFLSEAKKIIMESNLNYSVKSLLVDFLKTCNNIDDLLYEVRHVYFLDKTFDEETEERKNEYNERIKKDLVELTNDLTNCCNLNDYESFKILAENIIKNSYYKDKTKLLYLLKQSNTKKGGLQTMIKEIMGVQYE